MEQGEALKASESSNARLRQRIDEVGLRGVQISTRGSFSLSSFTDCPGKSHIATESPREPGQSGNPKSELMIDAVV